MSESNNHQHDPLEAELERLLKRKEPSAGFAARVLAQAGREDVQKEDAPRSVHRWRRFAIAAGLFAMVSSGGLYMLHSERQAEQQQAAEEAGRQALMALRITAGTLAVAREKVLEAGQAATDRPSQGEQQ